VELQEALVHLAQVEHLVHQELAVQAELQVLQVHQDLLVHLDQVEHLVHQELQVLQEQVVAQVHQLVFRDQQINVLFSHYQPMCKS
jgi:hypothetical protein